MRREEQRDQKGTRRERRNSLSPEPEDSVSKRASANQGRLSRKSKERGFRSTGRNSVTILRIWSEMQDKRAARKDFKQQVHGPHQGLKTQKSVKKSRLRKQAPAERKRPAGARVRRRSRPGAKPSAEKSIPEYGPPLPPNIERPKKRLWEGEQEEELQKARIHRHCPERRQRGEKTC